MENDQLEVEASSAPEEAKPTPSFSVTQTLKALVALTVISVGSGGFLGSILGTGTPIEPPSAEKTRGAKDISRSSEKQHGSAEQGHGEAADKGLATSGAGHGETAVRQSLVVKELPPIITNLGVPETSWVRLQAAIVYDAAATPDSELLVTQLTSDIVAFLRTVSLASIEGADGLRSLHEDLSERVTVRSEGRVHEFIIQALVVQ